MAYNQVLLDRRAPGQQTSSNTDSTKLDQRVVLNVLFVCTGNICRSPTAERLTAAYLSRFQLSGVNVASAGTRAVIGHAIHNQAAAVLQELGGDPSDFAARQLTPRIAAEADLILAMTKAHRDAVLERAPAKLHKTLTLVEAARLVSELGAETVSELSTLRPHLPARVEDDIADPIGQDDSVFEAVGGQIADRLAPVFNLLRRASLDQQQ